MKHDSVLFAKNRAEWRAWLAEHFRVESEIWLVFPTKASGETGVCYNDAVEEALCFGWIDTTAGKLDEGHGLRRFCPRQSTSYSRSNIERLIWLEEQGLLLPQVREEVLPLIRQPFHYAEDIIAELRRDETVWAHYEAFSEPYKRIRIDHIEAARGCPTEFAKRLKTFTDKTRENKLIVGFGGVEKYYH